MQKIDILLKKRHTSVMDDLIHYRGVFFFGIIVGLRPFKPTPRLLFLHSPNSGHNHIPKSWPIQIITETGTGRNDLTDFAL